MNLRGAVPTGSNNIIAIRAKSGAGDRSGVACESGYFFAGFNLPDPDRSINPGRTYIKAVGAKGRAVHPVRMSLEINNFYAGQRLGRILLAHLPHPGCPIPPGSNNIAAVRAKGGPVNRAGVSPQYNQFFAGRYVPHPGCTIPAG